MTQATDSTLQKPERSKKTTYQKLVQTLQNFQAYLQQTDGTEQEAIQKRIEKTAKLIANLALENQNKRDESLFGKIANKILDAKDLDTIFRTTTKELKQTLNCDRAAIYSFNPDWSGQFVAEYFEGNLVSLLEEQRYNPEIVDNVNACSIKDLGLQGRLLKTNSRSKNGNDNGKQNGNGSSDTYLKETRGGSFVRGESYRVCNDIYHSDFSPCYLRVLKTYQAEAYVIAAVYQGKYLWGLLAAYQSKPRKWNTSEIDLVVQLAKMLNIALQQREFQTKVEIQSKKLATRDRREKSLAKIVDRIRETDNLETILNITVSDIRQLMECDRAAIYSFNPDWSGQFIAESANSEWVALLEEQRKVPEIVENVNRCSIRDLANYEGLSGTPKLSKENIDTYLQQTKGSDFLQGENYRVCEDIYNSGFSDCYIKVLERYQARAYIIAAIYYNKQLWGLLAVYQNSGPRNWETEEIELISRFASQIGVGIRQTKYLKAIKAQNNRLKQNAQKEQILAKIVDRILQSSELQETFQNTMADLRRLLNVDRVAVYKISFETGNRHGKFIAEDVDNKYPRAVAVERIEDQYSLNNEPEIYEPDNYWVVEDIHQTKFKESQIKVVTQFETKAYINVALMCDGKLWGLLCVHQCSTRKWQQEEINLACQVASQLSVAIDRSVSRTEIIETARSEKEIALLVERLSESINQSEDLNQIWRSSLLGVRNIVKCDRVSVYRFNPDWSGEYIAESVGSDWTPLVGENIKTVWEDTHLQETQGGRYRNNETFVVQDIYQVGHSQCHIDMLEQFQVKAYIIAPIFVGRKLWGLLAAYQNTGPREWKQREVRLLAKLGVQFGLAVKQAEYLQKVQKQNAKLVRATEIQNKRAELAERIRQNRDIDNIFSIATGEIRQLLNCDRVVVYRFNPDWSGEFINEAIASSEWISLLEEQKRKPEISENVNNCTIKDLAANKAALATTDTQIQATQGQILTRGKVYRVCEDIYNSGFSDCYIKILEAYQTKAYIIVPIYENEQLWGLFAAYQNDRPRQWQEEEIDLMVTVGEKLGIAIEQDQYLKQLESKNQEIAKAAEYEEATVRLVERLTQKIGIDRSIDLNKIFEGTLFDIKNLLQCDRVTIYQFLPDWSGEYIVEAVDPRFEPYVGVDLKTVWEDSYLQETKGGRYRNGETLAVDDIETIGHSQCHVDILKQFKIVSYATVPIFYQGELWGILAAYHHEQKRDWQSQEVKLLAKLGTQFGIAFEQVEYVKQLQIKNQEIAKVVETEQALGLLGERIRQTQDIDSVFKYTLSEIRDLLKCDRIVVYRFNPDWSGEIIAESVTEGWISLMDLQQSDSKLQNDLIASDDCTVKGYGSVKGDRLNDTYLQENRGGIYAQGSRYRKVNDITAENFSACYLDSLRKFQAKAYINAPIYQGKQLWGLLAVYQNSGPRIWEDREVDLVVKISVQYSIAVQQAQYFQEAIDKNEKLTQLLATEKANARFLSRLPGALIELARATGKIEEILNYAVRDLRQLLKSDRVGIYCFDRDWSGEFIVESVGNQWPELVGTSKARVKDTYLQENKGGRYARRESLQVNNIYTVGHDECHINL
nr:GAF domain-containing protein [Prochloraceae cyanobacterium]